MRGRAVPVDRLTSRALNARTIGTAGKAILRNALGVILSAVAFAVVGHRSFNQDSFYRIRPRLVVAVVVAVDNQIVAAVS